MAFLSYLTPFVDVFARFGCMFFRTHTGRKREPEGVFSFLLYYQIFSQHARACTMVQVQQQEEEEEDKEEGGGRRILLIDLGSGAKQRGRSGCCWPHVVIYRSWVA